MHRLGLSVSNMIKTLQNIPIIAAYNSMDALSQVIRLMKPPHELKQRRHPTNTNFHLLEIAKLTNRKKEDLIL